MLHVRHEKRSDNQVDRTFTKHLVGDVDVTTFGVKRIWLHVPVPLKARWHFPGLHRNCSTNFGQGNNSTSLIGPFRRSRRCNIMSEIEG